MDNLRLILLIIGCLFVIGIYLWEILGKKDSRKHSDLMNAIDDYPESPQIPDVLMSAKKHDPAEDPFENYADLGSLLTKSRNMSRDISDSNSNNILSPKKKTDDIESLNSVNQTLNTAISADENIPVIHEEYITEKEIIDSESHVQHVSINQENDSSQIESNLDDEKVSEEIPDYQDILAFFITSPRQTQFNGLSIKKAADEVGMVFGQMNVFHHFGPGKLHSGKPLFSMANMFEPGSFELSKMAELNTKGIAMFMYLPTSLDSSIVFELFLNSSQQIAKKLGGEVLNSRKEKLQHPEITSLRTQFEQEE